MTPKHGYVLGAVNYYIPNFPWADVMKNGAGMNFRDAGVNNDADGWPTIPPTLSATAGIFFGGGKTGWFPPGPYRAFTSVTGLDVHTVASAGITETGAGPGWCTFTVADLSPDWSAFQMEVRVSNATAGTLALSRAAPLQVCLVADIPAVTANADADSPAYMQNFGSAAAFRACEHMQQNSAPIVQTNHVFFSDYGPQAPGVASYFNNPQVAVFLRRARRNGARPWMTVGNAIMQTAMDYIAATHRWTWVDFGRNAIPNRFVNGDAILFDGGDPAKMTGVTPSTQLMFVVGADAAGLNLSLTPGGAPLSWNVDIRWLQPMPAGGSDLGFGAFYRYADTRTADMFLPYAQECFARDPSPTVPIFVEWGNEPWNDGYPITSALRKVVAKQATTTVKDNTIFTGTSAEGSVGYIYGSMQCRKAFETAGYLPDNVVTIFNWFTGELDQWKNFKAGLDTLDVHSIYGNPSATFGDIIRANPQRFRFCVAPYINGISPGYAQTSPGGFNMQTALDWNGGSLTFTDAFWDGVYERSLRDNEANMHLIKASLTRILPGVKLVFYEWGQQIFSNNPGGSDPVKMNAVGASLTAYLTGPGGRRMLKRAFSECAIATGVEFVCYYAAEGGWTDGPASYSHWGIRDRNTDNAASTWWRTK